MQPMVFSPSADIFVVRPLRKSLVCLSVRPSVRPSVYYVDVSEESSVLVSLAVA